MLYLTDYSPNMDHRGAVFHFSRLSWTESRQTAHSIVTFIDCRLMVWYYL